MAQDDAADQLSYDPQALLNAQPVSLVIIDPVSYRVLYQNTTSREHFGPIADQPCHKSIAGSEAPCSFCQAPTAMQTGKTTSSEVQVPNGRWLLIQWTRVPAGNGQLHLVETITDITVLKREQERTQTLNAQLQEANRQLTHLNQQLKDKSVRDGLTGLYNHSYFQENIVQLCATAKRTNYPLSLIFLDLDNFKQINDVYGHKAGDEVLRAMGWLLDSRPASEPGKRIGRTSDVAARYGGDEFAIILPNTPVEGAAILAERLFRRIGTLMLLPELATLASVPFSLTASIGVATLPTHAHSPTELILAADRALYAAKAAGRNCIRLFVGPAPVKPARC
ncbi:MAG TPA: diguanylate cyclase [Nitrospiraceae bacterium]|nr:diguanylate cyclase [Nitrospiraceae bacterium]